MNDLQIIELFWKRDEAAIEKSDAKYGRLLHRISFNILSNKEDSEECVNDTYVKAWTSIPPQKPCRLSAYLGRITRNLSLNRWYENHAKKRGDNTTILLSELSDCVPAPQTVEDEIDGTLLTEAITHWLEALPQNDRVLFLRRYWFGDSLTLLADACKTTPNKLSGHMFRLRKSLKKHLEKEGITI